METWVIIVISVGIIGRWYIAGLTLPVYVCHVIKMSILLMHSQDAIQERCYVTDAIHSLHLLDAKKKGFPSVRTVIGWVIVPLPRILHIRGKQLIVTLVAHHLQNFLPCGHSFCNPLQLVNLLVSRN